MLFKRRKRKGQPLIKYLYFKNEELWYRSFRGFKSYEQCTEDLKEVYPQLDAVSKQYFDAFKSYIIFLGISFLFIMGFIERFEFSGFSLSKSQIALPLMTLLAAFTVYLTGVQARRATILGLFSQHFEKGVVEDRVRLLARFPAAFGFEKYRLNSMTVPYPLSSNGGILSQIILLIFMVCGLFLYILGFFCVYYFLGKILWYSQDFGLVGKMIVIASGGAMISSVLIPQGSFIKRSYAHYGLVYLLNRLHKRDRDRHQHFSLKIYSIKTRTPKKDDTQIEV